MPLIVEDGTGLESAESYDTIENIAAYAVKVGKSFPITGSDGPATAAAIAAAEAAARRATAWIDGEYRSRFQGAPTTAEQALEWPRSGVMYRGTELPEDIIHRKIKEATAEAAIRELANPGALSPDVIPGAIKTRVRVEGAVDVTYAEGAGAEGQIPVIKTIGDLLADFLKPKQGNTLVGFAARA